MQVVAAFQCWFNGSEVQTSAIYTRSKYGQQAVDNFINDSKESGTFAALHTFTSEEEAYEQAAYFESL